MSVLVGLVGYAKSGKTTAAEVLVENGFTAIAYADKLKNTISKVTGLPREYMDDQSLKERPFPLPYTLEWHIIDKLMQEYGMYANDYRYVTDGYKRALITSPRQLMTVVGTDILRTCDDEIHIRSTLDSLPNGNVVITDIRFQNEFDAIANKGGVTIGIVRDEVTPLNLKTAHVSEKNVAKLLPLCDIIIENNEGLSEFIQKVKEIL